MESATSEVILIMARNFNRAIAALTFFWLCLVSNLQYWYRYHLLSADQAYLWFKITYFLFFLILTLSLLHWDSVRLKIKL